MRSALDRATTARLFGHERRSDLVDRIVTGVVDDLEPQLDRPFAGQRVAEVAAEDPADRPATRRFAVLADRIETYLKGVRESRSTAERLADVDSADLFTQVVTDFEKHAWFLRASLAS